MKPILILGILIFNFQKLDAQNSLLKELIACFPINGTSDDYSGFGNHTGKVGTTLTPDRFGRQDAAFYFDGQAYLEMNPNQLKIDQFSVSIWVKPASLPASGQKQYIWSVGSKSGEQSIYLSDNQGFVVGGSISETETVYCKTGFSPTINKWYHLLMVRDINNLNFYLDGKLACSQTNIGAIPYYGFDFPRATFGRRVAYEASYFHGDMDDIHIYQRPINANEIKILYEGEKQPEIELIIDNFSPCGGDKINFLVKGAAETANFKWKLNEFKIETYINKYEFETIKEALDYDLKIEVEVVDDFSCFPQKPKKASNKIMVKECRELINLVIPNIFTPNNDGYNDTWQIPNLDRIPEAIILIYDHRGSLVFSSKGYKTPWTGKINNASLLTGTFNYVISTQIKGDKIKKGAVMLVR